MSEKGSIGWSKKYRMTLKKKNERPLWGLKKIGPLRHFDSILKLCGRMKFLGQVDYLLSLPQMNDVDHTTIE